MPGEITTPAPVKLFTPITVGDMKLKHRIVMGPMTRCRSPGELANETNIKYYFQRATEGGLLITEGTNPSITGQGAANVPRIFDKAGSNAWQPVCDAVHSKGGYICAQLWHTGRASASQYQKDGKPAISPSGGKASDTGEEARQASIEDIKFLIQEYKDSAKLSCEAGFDCVELHGAHGYLIDEFLQSSSNSRTDEYGGSIENRCRFFFEVLDSVLKELPASKIAVRFSPWFNWQNVSDENPLQLFSYVLTKLQPYKLAYIHLTEPEYRHLELDGSLRNSKLNPLLGLIKEPTKKMATGGYVRANAEEAITSGRLDLVGLARPFISNPDLVERLKNNRPLREYIGIEGYYGGREKGYIDHLTWEEEQNIHKTDEQVIL